VKILCWSGFPPLFNLGFRVHTNLPAALARQGHEVILSSWSLGNEDLDYVRRDVLSFVRFVDVSEILDVLPIDVFIYIDQCPPPKWSRDMREKFPSLLKEIRKKTSVFVYYCLDHWEGFFSCSGEPYEDDLQLYRSGAERILVSLSDFVFAVSPQLCVHLQRKYDLERVYWVPNGVERRWYYPHREYGGTPRRKVALMLGFPHGDLKEISDLVRKFPDWDFYGIGQLSKWKVIGHSPMGNWIALRERRPETLRRIAPCMSLGIVPPVRKWFEYFGDTNKWYLYHALELPVIVLSQKHFLQFPSFYPFTVTGRGLIDAFNNYLKERDKLLSGVKFCEWHSYDHRAQSVEEILTGRSVPYGVADRTGFHFQW